MEVPTKTQMLIDAIRGFAGMGPQQSQGRSTDVAGNYRRYVLEAAERGEQPMTLQEWQNSQAQPMPVANPPAYR